MVLVCWESVFSYYTNISRGKEVIFFNRCTRYNHKTKFYPWTNQNQMFVSKQIALAR